MLGFFLFVVVGSGEAPLSYGPIVLSFLQATRCASDHCSGHAPICSGRAPKGYPGQARSKASACCLCTSVRGMTPDEQRDSIEGQLFVGACLQRVGACLQRDRAINGWHAPPFDGSPSVSKMLTETNLLWCSYIINNPDSDQWQHSFLSSSRFSRVPMP